MISSILSLSICFILITAIKALILNLIHKSKLRKQANLYLAIQMLFDEGTEQEKEQEKNKFCELDMFELDSEINKIANKIYFAFDIKNRILKSRISILLPFYIEVVKEKLYDKEMTKHNETVKNGSLKI